MTTHHGGIGHTGEDRELISHLEVTGHIDICPDNDSESIKGSDATIPFEGSEADGHLGDLLHSSQANLTALTREINSLQQ